MSGLGQIYRDWHWLLIEGRLVLCLAYLSAAVVIVKFLKMGIEDHDSKTSGGLGKSYPPLYFAMLAGQIIPLFITGLVRQDALIIWTRGVMLLVTGLVYGMVKNPTGTFPWKKYRFWLYLWACALSIAVWAWVEIPSIKNFVADHESMLSLIFGWASVAAMFLFVIIGQGSARKAVLHGLQSGHYQQPGFWLQVARVTNFALQAIHYGDIGGIWDPICLASLIGLGGSIALFAIHLLGRLGIWRVLTKFFPSRFMLQA